MIMNLSVKNQSIESSGITKDYKEAICEYIWNGFEANATEVHVSYEPNELIGFNSISVSDNGDGIHFDSLQDTFGAFLTSQKNTLSLRVKSKANKGKGRFSFTAFSSMAQFQTSYNDNGTIKSYTICLSDENKESFEYDEPREVSDQKQTGTSVIFYNICNIEENGLSNEVLEEHLLREFAWYLYLNKHNNIKLVLNGTALDYTQYIDTNLSETTSWLIDGKSFNVSLIVWSERIKEKFKSYYFDSTNTIKGTDTTSYNRNTVDFNHSVFIQSSFFDLWDIVSLYDSTSQTTLTEPEEGFKILKKLKSELHKFIGKKLSLYMTGKADSEIEKMLKVRKTFPHFSDDEYGELRKRDLVRVTKNLYCLEPRIFYKLKEIQERSLLAFLNLLLSSDERESVITVIDEILELTTAQRKQLADILHKTHLENIIDTISFIENRYRVIEILKMIVYDLTKFANERDHIQKIIEQNYWLFGEQYHLASADQNMHRALEQYNYILYGAKDATDPLPAEDEADRRMDIFLCAARNVETEMGSYMEENIVVELKAPRVPLSTKVFRQIDDYMRFIRKNDQFNSLHRRWKFIAVCKSVDDDIKYLYDTFKDRGKVGLIHQSGNYEIYALTWDDIFTSFNLRHSFMLDKLIYDRNRLLEQYKLDSEGSREQVDALTQIATSE